MVRFSRHQGIPVRMESGWLSPGYDLCPLPSSMFGVGLLGPREISTHHDSCKQNSSEVQRPRQNTASKCGLKGHRLERPVYRAKSALLLLGSCRRIPASSSYFSTASPQLRWTNEAWRTRAPPPENRSPRPQPNGGCRLMPLLSPS